MANTFGVDPTVAGEMATELANVRAELSSPPAASGADAMVAGSAKIAAAMHEFFSDSTESRTRMGNLLERASDLLRQLSENTIEVDRGLAGALEGTAK